MPARPSQVFNANRADIRRIIEAHQVHNPRVFGSIARGEDTEGSDLDLLVDTMGGVSLFDIAAIELELEQLLDIPVHVTTSGALRGTLRDRVSRKPNPYERPALANAGLYQPHAGGHRAHRDLHQGSRQQCVRRGSSDPGCRNLEVLGEAARNIMQHDPDFVAAHPEVPWAQAYRMRNALSHGYAEIDLAAVWFTVRSSLPALRSQLTALPH